MPSKSPESSKPALSPAQEARNRLGTAVLGADPAEIAAARHDLTVAKLAQHIREVWAGSDGQIIFLVLVWLYAFVLPWFGSALPPEFHQVLSDSYATVAIALTITWRMLDKYK